MVLRVYLVSLSLSGITPLLDYYTSKMLGAPRNGLKEFFRAQYRKWRMFSSRKNEDPKTDTYLKVDFLFSRDDIVSFNRLK